MSEYNPFPRYIEPVKEAIEEKLRDPYLNAFVLSALIWNYQVFLYIFSDLSPDTKYALIERSLNWWSLFGPICLSFFYNLAFPVLFYYLYKLTDRLNIWVNNARENEKKAILTIKHQLDFITAEKEKLNKTLSEKDFQFGKQIEKLESEKEKVITDFQAELDQLRQQNALLRKELQSTKKSKPLQALNRLKNSNLLDYFVSTAFNALKTGQIDLRTVNPDLLAIIRLYNLMTITQKYTSGGTIELGQLSPTGQEVYQLASSVPATTE